MKRSEERRGLSLLLTLALLVTLAPALGGTAKATAGNAETLYIAGKTGADYGHEEQGTYEWGNWVYDKEYTALTNGGSVSYGNEWENGARATFTRAESGSSTLVLSGYLTWGKAGYVDPNRPEKLYGIYYDGDLTIQVYSECQIRANRSDAFEEVYGIYVTGDLTIETMTGGSLRVDMGGNAAMQAQLDAYGIYCGGTLTVGGAGAVTANAVTVSGMTGNSGDRRSCGVYAENYVQTGGTMNAKGGSGVAPESGTHSNALETYGVYSASAVTVSGGTLKATGGTVPMSGVSHGGRSVGILAGNLDTYAAPSTNAAYALTVSGTASVTAAGGAVNSSASNGNIAWNRSMSCGAAAGKVDVRGGTLIATGADITASGSNYGGNAEFSGGESFGVRCGAYVQSGGAVTATAGRSDIKPQKRYSDSYGVFTYKYDVSGGTLTASADQAWRESVGVMVHNELSSGGDGTVATQSGGTVSGTAGVVAGQVTPPTEPCQSTGVWFGGGYEATGGSLRGTAANIGYRRQSVGVLFNGDVSLSGGASVTGTGGDTAKAVGCELDSFHGNGGGVSDSCGVALGGTKLTLGEGCELSGTGGTVSGVNGAGYQNVSAGVWFMSKETVSVSGGGTLSGTGGAGTRGHVNGYVDNSYGVLAAGGFAASGVTICAAGGDVSKEPAYNGEAGQHDAGRTYGVYVTDGASFADCAVTASGGTVGYTGLYAEQGYMSYSVGLHSKALALDGANTMTLAGGAWSGSGLERYFKSYGLEFTGNMTVRGRLEARGHTYSIDNASTITAPAYLLGKSVDGSDAVAKSGPTVYGYQLRNGRCAVLDTELVAVTMIGATYRGSPVQTSLSNAPEGKTPTYHYSGRNDTEYDSADAPTDAGDYTVTVDFEGSARYGRTAFTIKPMTLTVTGLSAEDRAYDGTTGATLTGEAALSGVLDADAGKVSLSGTPAAVFADAEVGENKTVTVTGLALTGERAFNYQLGTLELTASITPAALSVTGSVSGGALTYAVTSAPAGAKLIAARYDGGRMTAMQTVTIDAGNATGTLTMQGSGTAYKLMLLDGATLAPLCPAWSNG